MEEMESELPSQVNTPETLGITPEYELKHLAIIRSAHNFSATAQKLTAMAMALLPSDLSTRTAQFSFGDFCKALGYEKGGESYKIFCKAVEECHSNFIKIETPFVTKRGKTRTSWEAFNWFEHSKYNADTGICTMTFSKQLADFLAEMKFVYSKLDLKDIGKLQSRFAIRLFEIAKSWESEKGKHGNKTDMWYFYETIDDFKLIMGIDENDYNKRANNLKRRVLDTPIKEINRAGLGLELSGKSVKTGRKVTGYHIDCKKVSRTVTPRKGKGKKNKADAPLALPMDVEKTNNWTDKELNRFRERYPDEFAELYAVELDKLSMPVAEEFKKRVANAVVLEILKERHG